MSSLAEESSFIIFSIISFYLNFLFQLQIGKQLLVDQDLIFQSKQILNWLKQRICCLISQALYWSSRKVQFFQLLTGAFLSLKSGSSPSFYLSCACVWRNSVTICRASASFSWMEIPAKARVAFTGFLDLRENLGNVKEKPTRKTCFSRVVCVCVYMCVCVCAFVCGCLYSFTCWLLPTARRLWHMRCLDQRSFVVSIAKGFCQVPSSPFPKLSYFSSKDVTPAGRKTGQKTIRYTGILRKDDIYWYRI